MRNKILVLLVLCFLVNGCAIAQSNTRTELFGIKLTKPGVKLLADVEAKYGKPLKEIQVQDADAVGAYMEVLPDGTPSISVNQMYPATLEIIFHELFHLKLAYPLPRYGYNRALPPNIAIPFVERLQAYIYDSILHYIYYPDARKQGIDPGKFLEDEIRKRFKENSLDAQLAQIDDLGITVFYYKILLEVQDKALIQRYTKVLENRGKKESIELGKKLAQMVVTSKPDTPEKAVKVYVDCLNYLPTSYKFTYQGLTTKTLGTHIQDIAQIAVGLK